MASAESIALSAPGGPPDSAAQVSTNELDLTTTQGLRQLQRNFILEEPRYFVPTHMKTHLIIALII